MKRAGIVGVTVLLIIVIVIAFFGYERLSGKYTPEDFSVETEKPVELSVAPDFSVVDINGNSVSLSELKGKPAVINFWATWCPPCKSELPYFENMYKKYGDKVEFMMVNLTDGTDETVESVNAFIEETGYVFPVYFDTQFSGAMAYGTYSIPVTVFVDKDGNLIKQQVGAISETILEAYVLKILG